MFTQVFFFKNSKVLKFSDRISRENYILINLLENRYQKSFVTGSLYTLNLTHIIPNGQTMLDKFLRSLYQIYGRYYFTVIAIYIWGFFPESASGNSTPSFKNKAIERFDY